MYTQCPDCSTAFRVTATDLKQAAGKVRCGGCGSAFDALELLSEEMPEQAPETESQRNLPELKPASPISGLPKSVSPEQSIALLKTLDQLAGSDIRIEDTGIEWRVLDDQVIADLETTDAAGDEADSPDKADQDLQTDEPRYDDDSPMPEDNGDPEASPPPDDDALHEEAQDGDAESHSDDVETDGERDIEVAFDDDETGDWEEILEEVDEEVNENVDNNGEPELTDAVDAGTNDSMWTLLEEDVEAEAESQDRDDAATGDDEALSSDEQEESDPDLVEDEADDKAESATAAQEGDDKAESATPAEENDDEAESATAAEESDDEADADDLPVVQEVETAFESIVMEGETIRNSLDDMADGPPAADADITYWIPPEESVEPVPSTAARFWRGTAALLLLLVLSLQVVHYYRETLATIPVVQQLIAPAYRVMGMPLSPDWDVTGWRFEATQGSADDDNDVLTVYSRIGNTTDKPLPYPLVGISLTDRFEETVGSRLLEPTEFLTGDANPRRLVPAGATFDAVISIRSPDEAAAGYKLNVCYRSAGGASAGQLRCAIGDFKE